MARLISIILLFTFSFNALAFGGRNSIFNKPLGVGKGSVGARLKKAKKAADKTINNISKEAGRGLNNIRKTTAKAISDTTKTVSKGINDTGKLVTATIDVTAKTIDETKRNVDRELTLAKKKTDKVLTKAYQDIRRESSKGLSNIKREVGKGLTKVGAVLKEAGQPENLLTIAIVYTASIYAGPLGSAFANSLMAKVQNPNLSDRDLFNSFVIGAAAGYAAQSATQIPVKTLQSMPSATSAIARNLTVDAGNILLNGKKYTFDDFVASIGKGAVNINTGDSFFNEVIDSSLNASASYSVDSLVHNGKIDLEEFERQLYIGMAQGLTRESVHALMDKYIVPLIPEEHKGLDKKLFGVLADLFVQQQKDIEVKFIEKFESLEVKDQREILEELNEINEEFKEFLAQKLEKSVFELTEEELSSEISMKLHEEFVSLELEKRIENNTVFEKLELSKEELGDLGRSPQSAHLVRVILNGLIIYGYYQTIEETKRVTQAYKQFKEETGKSFEDFMKENPEEFKGLAIDAALAMLPTVGVICKELNIGMKEGAKLVGSVNRLANDGKIFFEKGKDLIVHYSKHSKGIKSVLGLNNLSTKQYIDYARKVINEGTYIKSMNAYVKKIVKDDGKVRYLITGLKNEGKNISTFHVKKPRDLQKILIKNGDNVELNSIK